MVAERMEKMAKDSTSNLSSSESWWKELWHAEIYKRSQGRTARQVTFAALAVTALLGAWRMGFALMGFDNPAGVPFFRFIAPSIFAALGLWISYRVVNIPKFADFLIATEAEMNKVSWPSRAELLRGSAVVLFTIFALAIILFTYDVLWRELFMWLGIVPQAKPPDGM
jgi:preprotein translocase subunit SecE